MLRFSVAALGFSFALGCTSSSDGDAADDVGDVGDTGDGDGDSTDGDSTDGDSTDSGTDTDVEPLATITGVVLDMAGAALPSPGIQLCGPIDGEGNVEACIPVSIDDGTGEFTIGVLKEGLWALKCVHGPVDGRYFTGQSFQLTVVEGDALDYSNPPIVIPETDTVTDLSGASGPTDVIIDDVLTITLDPALAQTPDFTAPTELGGLEVGSEFWRVSEVDGTPVIAGWSFTPFGTHAVEDSGATFGFTLAGNLGLVTGDEVTVHAIQKDNGSIHEVATGTVNADATAIDLVPSADPLHELAWLLVTH